MFEYDLRKHARLEDTVLVPLMECLGDRGNNDYDSADLSERERQALTALARGLSNKEIADKMNISIHTVISHRKNIIRKTGIRTAQGLTLYAFINNLITSKDLR
jgi:DNA-binding CsgD family transcriptional regulator